MLSIFFELFFAWDKKEESFYTCYYFKGNNIEKYACLYCNDII